MSLKSWCLKRMKKIFFDKTLDFVYQEIMLFLTKSEVQQYYLSVKLLSDDKGLSNLKYLERDIRKCTSHCIANNNTSYIFLFHSIIRIRFIVQNYLFEETLTFRCKSWLSFPSFGRGSAPYEYSLSLWMIYHCRPLLSIKMRTN